MIGAVNGPRTSSGDDQQTDTTARRARGQRPPSVCSLRVVFGDKVTAYRLRLTDKVVIGRGADIVIPHVNVSRRHLAIRMVPSLEASDLGSTNLTLLFDTPLEPNMWVPLSLGDVLVVGGEALVVLYEGDTQTGPTRHLGGEHLERALAECLADYERSETPFGLCTVTCKAESNWVDVLAGVLLAHDHVIMLSDSEATVVLKKRSVDQIESVVNVLEGHLARLHANASVRLKVCPRDGTTEPMLTEGPPETRTQRTTMRPAGPVVRNPAMVKLYALVDEIAPSNVNVLVLGETGVGKDVLARALHGRSQRFNAPFLSLNCGALTETLLESELFGYERGAFTGAVTSKRGLLETAEGGTVFLDEVGEMPLPTQARFLRVLEERTVRPVGGLKPRPIDVRIIAATNRDLAKEIAEGRFRADLYYRLNGMSLLVPPLRERPDEVVMLATQFMKNAAAVLNRPTAKLSPEARACLVAYSWPGNIRELRNAAERASLLARGGLITPDLLPPEVSKAQAASEPAVAIEATMPPIRPPAATWTGEETVSIVHSPMRSPAVDVGVPGAIHVPADTRRLLDEVEDLEKVAIVDALAKCNGNQTRAAQLLGITRRVLINRIERYNLPRPRGPQGS